MKKKTVYLLIGLIGFLLPIIASGGQDLFVNSLSMGGLMVFFWITEVIPIYVTALIPFVVGVPLGILNTSQLALAYGDKNVFLFLGGFLLALALEKWDVHKQVARAIIKAIGYSKPRILLGFILSTALLSMWISNTATALMMLPMAMAVLSAMPKGEKSDRFPLFLMLGVAYSASVGGMGTLVGSPPNIQMAGILEQNFNIQVDFVEWMKIGFPIAVLMLAIIYSVFYLGLGKERKQKAGDEFELPTEKWNSDQIRVILIFGLVVIMWVFKNTLIELTGIPFRDEGTALLGAFLLFIVPSKKESKLLKWKDTEKLPWGILLLFGGGLALASSLEANGVISYLSSFFSHFSSWDYFWFIVLLVGIAIFGTELMSNLALVTVFIPIIASFASTTDYSILQLCIPVTLAASCAFMMPVGTPPNAIVFSSGKIKIAQMASWGILLNILAMFLISAMAFWLL
ncbi:MAG: sodium-dependent dicarboxylate transporter 2/3/5 [Psychromonas sp.]|jgi:sodium-dependent dicarboxylate transporter 2/3/5